MSSCSPINTLLFLKSVTTITFQRDFKRQLRFYRHSVLFRLQTGAATVDECPVRGHGLASPGALSYVWLAEAQCLLIYESAQTEPSEN